MAPGWGQTSGSRNEKLPTSPQKNNDQKLYRDLVFGWFERWKVKLLLGFTGLKTYSSFKLLLGWGGLMELMSFMTLLGMSKTSARCWTYFEAAVTENLWEPLKNNGTLDKQHSTKSNSLVPEICFHGPWICWFMLPVNTLPCLTDLYLPQETQLEKSHIN